MFFNFLASGTKQKALSSTLATRWKMRNRRILLGSILTSGCQIPFAYFVVCYSVERSVMLKKIPALSLKLGGNWKSTYLLTYTVSNKNDHLLIYFY